MGERVREISEPMDLYHNKNKIEVEKKPGVEVEVERRVVVE